MAKKKAKDEVSEVDLEAALDNLTKEDFTAVKVSWKGGRSRVYTKELHGESCMALAQEFCTKVSGTLEPLS